MYKKHSKSCIYQIRNLINNKIYIGGTFNYKERKRKHIQQLNNNNIHHSNYLQNSWNLYGKDNFIFEILEVLEIAETESKLDFKNRLIIKEQYYLDTLLYAQDFFNKTNKKFKTLGYNICPIANSNLGIKKTAEQIKKNSESHLGIKPNDKTKLKIKEAILENIKNDPSILVRLKTINIGKKQTKEHKNKRIEALKQFYKTNSLIGEKNPNYGKGKPINQYSLDNILIKEWPNTKKIQDELGFNKSPISNCCNKKTKSSYGFIWRYK